VSSVRRRRRQRPIAGAGRHARGPETALTGLVTVAHVRDVGRGDGCGRFGQGGLSAVGQHRGATVQRAQPALPSQVQSIAVGQPHWTAAQDCTTKTNNILERKHNSHSGGYHVFEKVLKHPFTIVVGGL